ncbi:hypothetical protein [Streptomyces candidus]|uniref:Uncharacterized protein n=1 Tax=Streptomyces candidus TaxID=67283 RepID=A0A7X0HKN7_9ACTN|nr:hypothetical protein [Streptomyces candidus]MBB6439435.1 hypothetical protein [Streptomyces candidus]GHH54747.1 hypothetical protein GCM10018773_58220 [Streptomyces candidus]
MSEIDSYDELKKQMTAAKERFASEVDGATMTVVKDDGLHRHLSFRFPKASWDWCEVVTWPGMLILRGGLGCWSFTRTEDMLDFFRPGPHRERIDPLYWEGKLVPGSGSEVKVYDEGRARAYVRQAVAEAVETHEHIQAEDAEDWLFSEFSYAEWDSEAALMRTLGWFEGRVDAERPVGGSVEEISASEFHFPVQDWDLHRYSDWFLLSCVVLPWAVEQYDAALVPVG